MQQNGSQYVTMNVVGVNFTFLLQIRLCFRSAESRFVLGLFLQLLLLIVSRNYILLLLIIQQFHFDAFEFYFE